MKTAFCVACVLLIGFCSSTWNPAQAQSTAPGSDQPQPAPPGTSAARSAPPTISAEVQGVAKMLEASIDPAVILAYIEHSKGKFQLAADDILYLHKLGASPDVITALIRKADAPAREQTADAPHESNEEAAANGDAKRAKQPRTIYTYVYPPYSVPWFSYPTYAYPSYRYHYSYRYPWFRYYRPFYRYNYSFPPFCFVGP